MADSLSGRSATLLNVEAVAERAQSNKPSDPRNPDWRCACCDGEFHVYAAWLKPVGPDVPEMTRGEPTRLDDLIQDVAYSLRTRPGTRVRVTIEEIE